MMAEGSETARRISQLRKLIVEQRRLIEEDRHYYDNLPGGWPDGAADTIRGMTEKIYDWEREIHMLEP